MQIDAGIDAIGRHPFRARFRRDLEPPEQAYAVDVICRWLERELEAGS
jgi:hypothetical protein